jgi:hypothetical protein
VKHEEQEARWLPRLLFSKSFAAGQRPEAAAVLASAKCLPSSEAKVGANSGVAELGDLAASVDRVALG